MSAAADGPKKEWRGGKGVAAMVCREGEAPSAGSGRVERDRDSGGRELRGEKMTWG